jgi:hypothetical protein
MSAIISSAASTGPTIGTAMGSSVGGVDYEIVHDRPSITRSITVRPGVHQGASAVVSPLRQFDDRVAGLGHPQVCNKRQSRKSRLWINRKIGQKVAKGSIGQEDPILSD